MNSSIGKELAIQKTTYQNKDNIKFDPNSTYEITFKYLPGFDMNNLNNKITE